ncbi:MAG: hypothetical protein CVU49_02835 [Candidatus Cloacimonetes bacterium HGW-Cloacimonetes-2]|jgi:16S rRNA (uracil1498-N3)-methyltransferase|nr:MAG: hypothetical protein CVU49_02835 [Candidatus Cloacimonetes bacterium HGW-Cloacimonetes-2]
MPSYFLPDLKPEVGSIQQLSGQEHHHLSIVSRARIGDRMMLNNGKGILAEAEITQIDKQSSSFIVTALLSQSLVPRYAIALSLLKNQNDELVIEKCTELGAGEFFPFTSRYSVRKPSPSSISRFEKIALAAIKQCDNPYLPMINPVMILKATLSSIISKGYLPVLCSEKRPDLWADNLDKCDPCFIIGPEGGWSEDEYELFKEIPHISISPLVTRAETAAIAIASQYLLSSRIKS